MGIKSGTKKKRGAGLSAFKTMIVFWFLLATVTGVYFFSVYIHNDYKIADKEPAWQPDPIPEGAPLLPNLVGEQWTEKFRKELAEGKSGVPIEPIVVYKSDSDEPKGTVLSQHPQKDYEAKLDEDGVCRSVTITVSGDGLDNVYLGFSGYVPEQALGWLENCGVDPNDVKRSYSASDKIEEGKIIALTYGDGSPVAYGEVVSEKNGYVINISTTKTRTAVPELVGKTETEARRLLAEAMLNVGKVKRELSTKPINQVLSQSIAEGSAVNCGDSIDLVVSEQSDDQFAMPNLMGMDINTAEIALKTHSLNVGLIIKQEDYHYDENTVIGQSVRPGAPVSYGAKVDLTIAVGGKSDTNVNWDSALVFINLEKNSVVSHATLERLENECLEKTVLIGVREKYMWYLPVGAGIENTDKSLDMAVKFGEECDGYDEIEAALRAEGVSRKYRFVFSAAAAPEMENGVTLDLKLGEDFANKSVQLYRLDENGNMTTVTYGGAVADSLGYATFTVRSAESFAVKIVD